MTRWIVFALLLAVAARPAAAESSPHPWLRAEACPDRSRVPQGGTLRIAVVLDIEGGYHVNANPPAQGFQVPTAVAGEPAGLLRWGAVRYPPGVPFAPPWAQGEISVYEGRAVILVEAQVADDAPPGQAALRLRLDYQGCDAATCYQPASRELVASVEVVEKGVAAEPANEAVFREAERVLGAAQPAVVRPRVVAGPDAAAPAASVRFEGETDLAAALQKGLPAYLATLMLFGLLLNLTPCVFPLIPVTMAVFAQQGESRPARVLPLAALYVLGLAATFTLVGLAAALAGRRMGLVLQHPAGVLAVVAVLAVMMASTFGAFDIRLPSGAMGRLGARRGPAGALVMGMVMGLVASPCVGPFLIALITFVAARGDAVLGAASFFVTGLGLGLPYVFLGTFTGLVNRFPRGGGWLIWTKRLMGLALGGLILYFVRPFMAEEFFRPLVLGVFIFAAAYLALLEGWSRRPFTRRFRAVRLATGAAVLAAGILVYADAVRERPAVRWTAWQPGALEAAQAEAQPVLLYFGADWCIACREWEATVFAHPAVVAESGKLARIYVDVTRLEDGPRKALAGRYRAADPPVVIVLDRRGAVLKAWRSPPDAAAFAGALRQAAGGAGGNTAGR